MALGGPGSNGRSSTMGGVSDVSIVMLRTRPSRAALVPALTKLSSTALPKWSVSSVR